MSDKVKVTIVQDTVAASKLVREGETLEVSISDARILTNIGRATYTDRMLEPEGREEPAISSKTTATSKARDKKHE